MLSIILSPLCKFYLKCRFYHFWQTVVFAALSEYLHQAMFTDVVLVVGHQRLRAHKVVLSSSCKFFRDAFKHHPGMLFNHYLTNWMSCNISWINDPAWYLFSSKMLKVLHALIWIKNLLQMISPSHLKMCSK